ncbi:phytoene desaturase family protein [Nocardia sp. NPDC058633]|uniref:phytoene desaturase family protein n=1 Tax=Nocardia sp. NPDC058633 TaxID=3346568 RepID=UPI00365C16CB
MSTNITSGSPRYDAIIIGSGLGGSSAAAHLAATGQRVLLLERYSVLGGTSHVFRRQGKWEFDCGVHFVGDCGPDGQVPTLLRGLGLDDRIEWLPLESESFDTIIGPDFALRTPFGWDSYQRNLLETFPDERRGILRLMSVLRSLGENVDRDQVPGTPLEVARYLAKVGPKAAAFAGLPYMALLVACNLRPRTILALSVQNGALATTPLGNATIMQAGYFQNYVGGGAYYPKGGGQVLAAGFAEVIRSHGGSIRTNAGVQKILLGGGKVTGVLLESGETILAPVVVSATDIIRTYTDLVGLEHLPAVQRARIRAWKMSRPLINGFFGIEQDLSNVPNSNYFSIPTWEDATSLRSLNRMSSQLVDGKGFADGRSWAREFARRQPMYVMSSSRRDPSHAPAAPAGHSTVEVQTIAPFSPALWGFDGHAVADGDYRQDKRYLEVKKIIIDGMLERMEQAYPGSSNNVRLAELASPASQQRFVGNTGGAPFGLETRTTQIGPLRPGSRGLVPGLFLAGTSTRWGPGTEGAMLSGRHAAGAILGRDLAAEVRAGGVLSESASLATWGSDFDALESCRGPECIGGL